MIKLVSILAFTVILLIATMLSFFVYPCAFMQASIEFDSIEANTKLVFYTKIHNYTYQDLIITKYYTGCPCNSLQVLRPDGSLEELSNYSIPARSSICVKGLFSIIPNPKHVGYRQDFFLETNHHKYHRLTSSVSCRKLTSKLLANPPELVASSKYLEGSSTVEFTLQNGSNVDIVVSYFEVVGLIDVKFMDVSLPINIGSGKTMSIKVAAKPSVAGTSHGALVLHYGKESLTIPIAIHVEPCTTVSSQVLVFPNTSSTPFESFVIISSSCDILRVDMDDSTNQDAHFEFTKLDNRHYKLKAIVQPDSIKKEFVEIIYFNVVTLRETNRHRIRLRNIVQE